MQSLVKYKQFLYKEMKFQIYKSQVKFKVQIKKKLNSILRIKIKKNNFHYQLDALSTLICL